PVTIPSPTDASDLVIGMVHQHFTLVDTFTVAENIILGKEPKQFGKIDKEQAIQQVQELSARYGLKIDPAAKVSDISGRMQERAEILKT
ncbi:heme ABC transporter ATP-binding protein, partial [Bacillus pumilus]